MKAKDPRHTLYGTIHQKAKVLEMTDEAYRGFLFALTSKWSCKDLSSEQLESVDDILNDKVEELFGKTTYAMPETTPKLYKQDRIIDKTVYAMLMHPKTGWIWYIFEYDPFTKRCFGLVNGHEAEMGYFWLPELEQNGVLQVNMQPTLLSKFGITTRLKKAA